MTVTIPSQNPQTRTAQEKREHVIAYLSRPHGTKTAYLTEHGISPKSIRKWNSLMADGDIEQGLVPRKNG